MTSILHFPKTRARYVLAILPAGFVVGMAVSSVYGFEEKAFPVALATLTAIVYLFLAAWGWKQVRRHGYRFIDLIRPTALPLPWYWLAGALIFTGSVSIFIASVLTYVWPSLWSFFLEQVFFAPDVAAYALFANVLTGVTLVILGPIVEEFIFRGVLLGAWLPRWGWRKALATSTILFGVGHFDPLGASLFGFFLGLLYLRTGSLRLPLILHTINNATVLPWVWTQLEPGYVLAAPSLAEHQWTVGISALVAILTAPLFVSVIKRLLPK